MVAWNGQVNLQVASLDDFEMVLVIDFLVSAKVMVIPHLGGVIIMGEAQPCFMAGVHKEKKGKEPLLSAMQVKHGLM